MCVAIFKPRGAKIPEESLRACYEDNPHGCGFALAVKEDGKYKIDLQKGFLDFDDFLKAWKDVSPEYQALLHFRVATHGGITAENTHPFAFSGGGREFAMVHNGTLGHFGHLSEMLEPTKSDSNLFAERILGPLAKAKPDFFRNPTILRFLDHIIQGNKIVIMAGDAEFVIFNEQGGTWCQLENEGPNRKVWFSNTWWRRFNYPRSSNGRFLPVSYRSKAHDRWPLAEMTSEEEFYAAMQAGLADNGRASPDHNQRYWIEGQRDAKAGIPFTDGLGEWYTRGFKEQIAVMFANDELFRRGYNAVKNGKSRLMLTPAAAERSYSAGWEWGQYFLSEKAIQDKFKREAAAIHEANTAKNSDQSETELENARAANKAVIDSLFNKSGTE